MTEALARVTVKLAAVPSATIAASAAMVAPPPLSSSVIAKVAPPLALAPPLRPVPELAFSGASEAMIDSEAPSFKLSCTAVTTRPNELAEGPTTNTRVVAPKLL